MTPLVQSTSSPLLGHLKRHTLTNGPQENQRAEATAGEQRASLLAATHTYRASFGASAANSEEHTPCRNCLKAVAAAALEGKPPELLFQANQTVLLVGSKGDTIVSGMASSCVAFGAVAPASCKLAPPLSAWHRLPRALEQQMARQSPTAHSGTCSVAAQRNQT